MSLGGDEYINLPECTRRWRQHRTLLQQFTIDELCLRTTTHTTKFCGKKAELQSINTISYQSRTRTKHNQNITIKDRIESGEMQEQHIMRPGPLPGTSVPGEALVALGAHSAKEIWIELERTSAKTTRGFKVAMKVLYTKRS